MHGSLLLILFALTHVSIRTFPLASISSLCPRCSYIAIFPRCLALHLDASTDESIRSRIAHLVHGRELDIVLSSHNRPSAVLQLVTAAAGVTADMDTHLRYKLDGAITALMDASNVLEKLLRTPIPLSYTRHTSRACLMLCYYIPLTLYADLGLVGSSLASAFITFLLLGLEVRRQF